MPAANASASEALSAMRLSGAHADAAPAAATDLAQIVGTCAGCRREGLPASAFSEPDLRRFLAEQTSARGRSEFTDVRGLSRSTQVAGASLFCSVCAAQQRQVAAAADTTWDDEEVEVASAAAVVPPHGAAATSTEACVEAAHSWEELEGEPWV